MATIAVANQKGGVGKSTTAINLGATLAKQGLRVLIVDLDPQGNATSGLGLPKDGSLGTYQLLLERAALVDAVTRTRLVNLDIVASSSAMAAAEVELVSQIGRESLLRTAIRRADHRYDVALIDCPPSLGLLTVNALVAASHVLIPVQCEYFALEGLSQLLEAINLVRERLNPDLRILGLLMTMEDRRNRLTIEVIDDVKQHFPEQLLETRIPRSVRVAEAPSHGKPVGDYDPDSRAAQAYAQLAREIVTRLRAGEALTTTGLMAHG